MSGSHAPSAHNPAPSAPAEPAPRAHDLAARRGIVLATGSRTRTLPGLEPGGRRVVTSDDALFAPGLPASALVPGGGAIGVEYASFLRSMAAEVTLVGAADRIVPLEDSDVSRHLTRGLKKRGIDVQAGARPLDAELLENGVRARVRTARGETRTVEVERLLVAVGRAPATEGLDLAAAGLGTDATSPALPPSVRASLPRPTSPTPPPYSPPAATPRRAGR